MTQAMEVPLPQTEGMEIVQGQFEFVLDEDYAK